MVERWSPELHTDLVRVCASARTENISVWMMHYSVHMYVVWLLAGGSGGFTGISLEKCCYPTGSPIRIAHIGLGSDIISSISRDAKICPGFPPPQAALAIATSREKGLWVESCSSGEKQL